MSGILYLYQKWMHQISLRHILLFGLRYVVASTLESYWDDVQADGNSIHLANTDKLNFHEWLTPTTSGGVVTARSQSQWPSEPINTLPEINFDFHYTMALDRMVRVKQGL